MLPQSLDYAKLGSAGAVLLLWIVLLLCGIAQLSP